MNSFTLKLQEKCEGLSGEEFWLAVDQEVERLFAEPSAQQKRAIDIYKSAYPAYAEPAIPPRMML